MTKLKRSNRPSAATVLAVIALVAALGGTGVAATTSVLGHKEKKQVKKLSRKIANKRISRRAGKLSVANAKRLAGVPGSAYVQRSELAPVSVSNLALHAGWRRSSQVSAPAQRGGTAISSA